MLQRLSRSFKKFLVISLVIVLICLTALAVFSYFYLEPILRKKIHTLIIDGSDSLYQYKLGKLQADFLGGDVEVENLEVYVDSNRYQLLKAQQTLPNMTLKLKLAKGHIKGVGLMALIFGKRIKVEEILSKDANIVLSRHFRETTSGAKQPLPLWRSMKPAIQSISVDRLKLDGVKMLFNNSDTSESVKLQFDRFDAVFDDIRIDSAAAFDTSRISFVKSVFLKFHDLKFRSSDSTYKLKAEWITYSSETRTIEVDSFKLQPTLDKETFYQQTGLRKSLYYFEFEKVRLVNAPLEKYLHQNIVEADSIIIYKPDLKIYMDKGMDRNFSDKSGSYPHQKLAKSKLSILIKNILLQKTAFVYTEKNGGTGMEGNIVINDLDLHIKNITNIREDILKDGICTASANGRILGNSPIQTNFKFYLDSSLGRFDVSGVVGKITAAQLNPIAVSLANIQLPSLTINKIDFSLRVDEYTAWSNVDMLYNDLSIALRKTDVSTGTVSTRKFLTNAINHHMIYPHNPYNGATRTAREVRFMRLTTQSFFGVIWKALFAGMQAIMMRSGNLGTI
ncbi:MAG: hypothetical protein H0U44_12705 [Flavisolibacter sp.]|jgi:hypothetical protein|nr:hypothetical protein [Flavisolibacter sp.]